MATLCLEASVLREESRDSHYREDFPNRDDENWLKWIGARLGAGGKTKLEIIPVPYERYSLKPGPGRKIPYPIQYTLKAGNR